MQELKPNDQQARRTFSDCAQNELAADSDFHKKIFFNDEAQDQ